MEPILEFYEKRCGKKIEFYTCTLQAEIVKHCGIPYLSQNFAPDTPVQIVDEIGFGMDNKPLHHSIEYHLGNHMRFGLIRLMEPAATGPQSEVTRRALDKLNSRISASDQLF